MATLLQPSEIVEVVSTRYYRPELDALRALAFFAVFLHHAIPSDPELKQFAGWRAIVVEIQRIGGFGLNLFFVLSAFLICELLLREKGETQTVNIKKFYVRRSLRIWPLYYFALFLGIAASYISPDSKSSILYATGWYVIFAGSWYNVLHGFMQSPASPLWSISVEEQFYLVAPWAIRWLNRRNLFVLCGSIIFASNATLCYLGSVHAEDVSIWCNSIVQFECFAAGIILCLILNGRMPDLKPYARFLVATSAVAFWILADQIPRMMWSYNRSIALILSYLLMTFGSSCLFLSFLGIKASIHKFAIDLGRISFGLYVYHAFAILFCYSLLVGNHGILRNTFLSRPWGQILISPISLSLTAVIAKASYRYLETPFLQLKKNFTVVESRD